MSNVQDKNDRMSEDKYIELDEVERLLLKSDLEITSYLRGCKNRKQTVDNGILDEVETLIEERNAWIEKLTVCDECGAELRE